MPLLSYAQTEISNHISVVTDKTYYEFDYPVTIIVSGNVSENVIRDGELVIIQVFNPNGVLYTVDFANVTLSTGSYSYELKLGGGMADGGKYRVVATYRGQYQAETNFDFEGSTIRDYRCAIGYCTFDVTVSNVTHTIHYKASGLITNVTADTDTNSLQIQVSTPERSSGLLLALPRSLIQAIDIGTGNDTMFAVFIDGVQTGYDDIPYQARQYNLVLGIGDNPEDYRILSGLSFSRETKEIEIVGTWMAPEFSSIIAAILLGSTVGLVVIYNRVTK